MTGQPDFDPFTIDRLLDGATAGPADVQAVVDALSVDVQPSELAGEQMAVDGMAATIAAPVAGSIGTRRRMGARTGALAAVGALAFTGVAAAATGVPVPVVEDVFGAEEPVLVELDDAEIEDLGLGADDEKTATGDDEFDAEDEGGQDGDEGDLVADNDDDEADEDKAEDVDGEDGNDLDNDEKDNHGSVVSEAAKSDCGKKNVDPQPEECGDVDNHGEYVSEIAKENGKAGENGNANKSNDEDESEDEEAEEAAAEPADPPAEKKDISREPKGEKSPGNGGGNGDN